MPRRLNYVLQIKKTSTFKIHFWSDPNHPSRSLVVIKPTGCNVCPTNSLLPQIRLILFFFLDFFPYFILCPYVSFRMIRVMWVIMTVLLSADLLLIFITITTEALGQFLPRIIYLCSFEIHAVVVRVQLCTKGWSS